jgi:hypothetical protein
LTLPWRAIRADFISIFGSYLSEFSCSYTLHNIPSLLKLRAMARLLIFIVLFSLQTSTPTPGKTGQPEKQQASSGQKPANPDQRGTEHSPLVVKSIPSPKTQEETDQEAKDRNQKTANDRISLILTGIIATIAFGQLIVYWYQSIQLKKTVKSAGEQSKAMDRHIDEATRSANAMEKISETIQAGNREIMRAYLSVIIGMAVYQERQEGKKFEGKPLIVNTGSTPARNLRVWISADIMAINKAETFDYPLSEEMAKAPAVAAPHQNYALSVIVKNFVPDIEVADIKHGQGKALTVWGVVTYDDVFGEPHSTKFAQWLFWNPDQSVYGYYIPGQNDMS